MGFLLTLRSNHAIARILEGRKIWSQVVTTTREMATMVNAFIVPEDSQLGLMLARHLALFAHLSALDLARLDDEKLVPVLTLCACRCGTKQEGYVKSLHEEGASYQPRK